MKHLKPKQVRHCRQAARKHGVYAADKYSIRAYLRAVDALLMRIEVVEGATTDLVLSKPSVRI